MSDTVLTPMLEPARRLENLTGAGHRRSWGAVQKASIVAESVAGGEMMARRHGLARRRSCTRGAGRRARVLPTRAR